VVKYVKIQITVWR